MDHPIRYTGENRTRPEVAQQQRGHVSGLWESSRGGVQSQPKRSRLAVGRLTSSSGDPSHTEPFPIAAHYGMAPFSRLLRSLGHKPVPRLTKTDITKFTDFDVFDPPMEELFLVEDGIVVGATGTFDDTPFRSHSASERGPALPEIL